MGLFNNKLKRKEIANKLYEYRKNNDGNLEIYTYNKGFIEIIEKYINKSTFESDKDFIFGGRKKFLYNEFYDYLDNKERMAKIMSDLSKLDNAPTCQINFGVKGAKECKRKILSKAYKEAELQAQAIAEAAGKSLKQCVKVDFKPFTTDYVSQTTFDSDMMYAKSARLGAAPAIINTFTPEDIELSETLYCLWLAE